MDFWVGFMLLACIPATVAGTKGRNWFSWHIYGFWLFPIALVHSIFMSKDNLGNTHFFCPFCQEPVKNEAIACPHCRRDIYDEEDEGPSSSTSQNSDLAGHDQVALNMEPSGQIRATESAKALSRRSQFVPLLIFISLIVISMGSGLYIQNQGDHRPNSTKAGKQSVSKKETKDEKVSRLYSEALKVPAANTHKNLSLYKELLSLDPANEIFKAKVEYYLARLAENQGAIDQLDPKAIVRKWENIGLDAEIPWRKSQFPTENYSYISQCRGHIGPAGASGFQTEISCELLGHKSTTAHQVMIGVECWNPRTATDGRALALRAINAIGVEVPTVVVEAFKNGHNKKVGDWEVVDESSERLKEIRVYFRPNTGAN